MGLYIEKSINGKGIFTDKTVTAGKQLFEVTGKIVHYTKTFNTKGSLVNNTFRYNEEHYLSPQGKIGDYLNHSCNPNCKIVKKGKKLFVVALKPIKPKQEITIDYSTILANDDIWTMKCKCGSKKCRGKITNISKLPPKLFKKYTKEKIIPDYIQKINKEME
jgi:hypothetical protein